jgi:hypothetical protein
MSTKTPSAQDDLAFMRALVEGSGNGLPVAFGEAYFAAGLIYGLQILIQSSSAFGLPALSPGAMLVFGIAPTVLFLGVLAWIIWRNRGASLGGVAARAVGATFGSIGLANFALMAVIGSVALRQHSLTTWLIYPCVVFVMQGAAWLIASALRKRAWLGLVGIGWFVAAVAMALAVDQPARLALAAGIALLVLMVIPGALLMRMARKSA